MTCCWLLVLVAAKTTVIPGGLYTNSLHLWIAVMVLLNWCCTICVFSLIDGGVVCATWSSLAGVIVAVDCSSRRRLFYTGVSVILAILVLTFIDLFVLKGIWFIQLHMPRAVCCLCLRRGVFSPACTPILHISRCHAVFCCCS